MIQDKQRDQNGATEMDRVKLNMQRKRQPGIRRQGIIDSFRPLTLHDAAVDLDVQHIHLFPERDGFVLTFVTALGSTNVVMTEGLARQLADGLRGLVGDQQAA
jgi:hypothetical protein